MGQEEDPPTNLSNHGRKGRASSPLVKYLEIGVFLSRSASDLPSFGASVSILSGGRPSFFGWQKSPFRKAKNFCAHENKFPHMRKYFFLYTEINFLICGNFTPCKPAGNAGRVGRVDSRREKPWVDTSSPSFRWGKEGLLGWRKKDLWPSRRTLVQSLSECLELVADLPKLIQRVAA